MFISRLLGIWLRKLKISYVRKVRRKSRGELEGKGKNRRRRRVCLLIMVVYAQMNNT